jgi:hypothetical protein
MNNDPNRQQGVPKQPPSQYEPQEWSQPHPQAWEQQPLHPPQSWEQQPAPAYTQPQYNQYSNVPPYAQPQVQSQQADNFLMRFLMMGMAVRIFFLVIVPLLLIGGCALVVFFASFAHP